MFFGIGINVIGFDLDFSVSFFLFFFVLSRYLVFDEIIKFIVKYSFFLIECNVYNSRGCLFCICWSKIFWIFVSVSELLLDCENWVFFYVNCLKMIISSEGIMYIGVGDGIFGDWIF